MLMRPRIIFAYLSYRVHFMALEDAASAAKSMPFPEVDSCMRDLSHQSSHSDLLRVAQLYRGCNQPTRSEGTFLNSSASNSCAVETAYMVI